MTIASSSECGPISLVTLPRTSMLVILFLYDMFNTRFKHRISNVVIFLCSSFVIVHVPHAYKKIELTSDCSSRIFSFSFSVLSYHITFSLDRAAIVCPVLANISAFEPLSSMIAHKYLKLSTTFSGSLFIFISDVKLSSEFAIICVFVEFISIPYALVNYFNNIG